MQVLRSRDTAQKADVESLLFIAPLFSGRHEVGHFAEHSLGVVPSAKGRTG